MRDLFDQDTGCKWMSKLVEIRNVKIKRNNTLNWEIPNLHICNLEISPTIDVAQPGFIFRVKIIIDAAIYICVIKELRWLSIDGFWHFIEILDVIRNLLL